jgi:hypothetical protein
VTEKLVGKVGVDVNDPVITPVKVLADKLAPPSDAPVSIVPLRLSEPKFWFAKFALVRFTPGPTM